MMRIEGGESISKQEIVQKINEDEQKPPTPEENELGRAIDQTIKDFYESQGETEIQGSRDAIRLAFKRGLIENGETWMKMIKSRTLTAHTYNEGVASEILKAVFDHYYPEFILLMDKFNGLKEKESNRI